MSQTETLFNPQEIQVQIERLASEIKQDFSGEAIHLVGVLNGSFVFMADLVRSLHGQELTTDFISVSSYEGTESTGQVEWRLKPKIDFKNKNVIFIEDIVDTGRTMDALLKETKDMGAKTIKVCSLLHKPSREEIKVDIDYLGFTIEDKFVIGYGLDFDGRYRELPFIGVYLGDS